MDPILEKLAAYENMFQRMGEMHEDLLQRHNLLTMKFTLAIGLLLGEIEQLSPDARSHLLLQISALEEPLADNALFIKAAEDVRQMLSEAPQ